MLHLIWIVGALFVTAVSTFERRHERHAMPAKFWLEALETFLFLAGLMTLVSFAVYLAT